MFAEINPLKNILASHFIKLISCNRYSACVHHYAIFGHEKGVIIPVWTIIRIRGDFFSPTKTYFQRIHCLGGLNIKYICCCLGQIYQCCTSLFRSVQHASGIIYILLNSRRWIPAMRTRLSIPCGFFQLARTHGYYFHM